jgi:hypothetical protein
MRKYAWPTLLLVLGLASSCERLGLPGDSGSYLKDFWGKTVTKCGDSYWYRAPFGLLAEYKNFEREADEQALSQVDHDFNKVEWRVSTYVKNGVAYRMWKLAGLVVRP